MGIGFNLIPPGGGASVSAAYNAATKTVSGKAPAGKTVTIKVNGANVGTAVADSNGLWSYTFGTAPASGAVLVAEAPVPANLTVPAPPPAGMKIIVLIMPGQSNQRSANDGMGINASDIAPDPKIRAWNSGGGSWTIDTERQASEPLPFPQATNTVVSVGSWMPMAKSVLGSQTPDLIFGLYTAVGGTGYVTNGEWEKGNTHGDGAYTGRDALYNYTVFRINALKAYLAATYPGATIEWNFCGFAGEDDILGPALHRVYLNALVTSMQGLITDCGLSNVGIIKSRMSPAYVSVALHANAMDSAQIRLREKFPRTWIVDGAPGPYDAFGGNSIHYAAPAQVINGQRTAAKYTAMRARTVPFSIRNDFADTLSVTPYACHSLWRRLRAGYTGPLFRVNTALTGGMGVDIYPDGTGFADLSAIGAAIGSSDAFVETIYDQSGNGRHFTSVTGLNRPQIAVGGQLLWFNGRPVCGSSTATGATVGLAGSFDVGSAGQAFFAGRIFSTAGTRSLLSSRGLNLVVGNTLWCAPHGSGSFNIGGPTPAPGVHVLNVRPSTTTPRNRVDGADVPSTGAVTIGSASAVGLTTLLHREVTPGTFSQASGDLVSEIIMHDAAWSSADEALIEAAMIPQYFADPYQ